MDTTITILVEDRILNLLFSVPSKAICDIGSVYPGRSIRLSVDASTRNVCEKFRSGSNPSGEDVPLRQTDLCFYPLFPGSSS